MVVVMGRTVVVVGLAVTVTVTAGQLMTGHCCALTAAERATKAKTRADENCMVWELVGEEVGGKWVKQKK